ncbi:YggS family pyridoxal phosphate-dependent enzyme [Halanaerobacter jeridensis]|uniref:Pyridoxal phosphate homeostasis protein n=1 Tax=Halanaerobacter jeridensis TaxID=706427 RepID=A0A938XTV1_9FIRM|nr:pyridoxal phosphate enzyme (YggS family) [Halanaerobacter jeridensis]
MSIKERLAEIQNKIVAAARRVNRDPKEIKLIAVSKNQELAKIDSLQEEGVVDFGESRVQALRDRYEQFPEVKWHMIGHLQRNKVKYLARMERCELIHSLDSLRLAKKINKRAGMEDRVMKALVQVNIAEDENKYGLYASEIIDYLHQVSDFENLQIKGLMTILPHVDDAEELRPYFKEMKNLFDRIKEENISQVKMDELSMGMSNDFEVAIEEGATMIRLGRSLFGSRGY